MTFVENSRPIASQYDCIVIGGGPAGSTVAALVAKAGFSVLLVERERFPRRHVGESLMPDSYFVFQRLGMLDKLKKSGYAKKVGVQFVNHKGRESAPFLFRWNDPHECSDTWHVPRPEFDQMLFENAAESGADCRQGVRVLDVLMEGDRAHGVRLQADREGGNGSGESQEVRAKVVVDATGQQAILSSKLGLRRVNPALKKAAIWGHFRGAKRDVQDGGVYTIVLHTNQRKSWFWYIPQADDVVSVGVVGDNDYMLKGRGTPKEIFFEEVAKCTAVASRMEGAEQVDELIVAKEFSYLTDRSAGDGWTLVGDAWGFIDPVYSSGVFFALKSGEVASDCVIEALRTGDTSAAVLGKWVEPFGRQTNFVRKLVHAFYSGGFRVGQFVKEFPHHRGELTNLLIGRVFDGKCGKIFDDLEPFLERMERELPPEDPDAEPEDANIPGACVTPMRIAYLAAGAAGMYCGSCLHDNTLAAALLKLGEDVVLVPIYTPIRTDEVDVSQPRVFFGGINAYLQQKVPFFRRTPRWLDGWLDHPAILRLVASRGVSVDPSKLGAMTVSMLRGEEGNQHKELDKLVDWLLDEVKPDVVHLSNALMIGLARKIAQRCGPPIVCSLSGEDIFLEKLTAPYYDEARRLMQDRANDVDAFVALNRYYADSMIDYLGVPPQQVHVVPHGLDLQGHGPRPSKPPDEPLRVGYFARICHDKGFHLLVEACELLANRDDAPPFHLHAAGYLSRGDRPYFEAICKRIDSGRLRGAFTYHGELSRQEKIAFLQSLDVFSTPTVYPESKGLPVLEAWANGVPAVVPAHGTFPELVAETGGGLLHRPLDALDLSQKIAELLVQPDRASELGRTALAVMHARRSAETMAVQTLDRYRRLSAPSRATESRCESPSKV